MKPICLYFQIHQPFRLKEYRFFNMGKDHFYLDDFANRSIMQSVANKCYVPMNEMIARLITEYGDKFKVSFSISGVAIEQFRLYMPVVLDSFKKLVDTGCVEILGETYSHSLASLVDPDEFKCQVERHSALVEKEFGVKPKAFRNTELIYSDGIGEQVYDMGFTTMLTEGAKHILGWKSPDFVYANAINPRLKLLLRNFKLSDDISFRFSDCSWAEHPLTAGKYVSWLQSYEKPGDVINLFMDYETFGERQSAHTGIFEFFEHFVHEAIRSGELCFATPSEVTANVQPTAVLHSPYPISWADEERDVTAWLGNELQIEAFSKLYQLRAAVIESKNPDLLRVWDILQNSDHFYYMATKWFSDRVSHDHVNPYGSPYEAFINYMNVFSDFSMQVRGEVTAE